MHEAGLVCTDNADKNNDGTADQCEDYEGSNGSQCDEWAEKCTVPYRDRKVKTVAYWVNREMSADYQDVVGEDGKFVSRGPAEDVIYAWNQTLRGSVAHARASECRRTGDGTRETCTKEFFAPKKVMLSFGNWLIEEALDKRDVLVTCHNPVRSYDNHDVCGPEGETARLGDIRKFFMIDWPYAERARYGGVANLSMDPLTGEYIGNTATTVHTESRARATRDALLVAMGDLSLEEYADGVAPELLAKSPAEQIQKPLPQETRKRQIEAVDTEALQKARGELTTQSRSLPDVLRELRREREAVVRDTELLAEQAMREAVHFAAAKGTSLEAELVNSDLALAVAGLDPSSELTDDDQALASPLGMHSAARLAHIRAELGKRAAAAGHCHSHLDQAAGAGSVVNASLAGYFKKKYGHLSREERADALLHELKQEAFKGVMSHEVGHTLGMRHQFASSWDSVNYMPQYWQLRTNEGKGTAECDRESAPHECMGPRYRDPHTEDELGLGSESRPAIEYFGNTTTMEYQSERFSETSGLGPYDYFMSKAVYGRVLEAYDSEVVPRHSDERLDQEGAAARMLSHLQATDNVMHLCLDAYLPFRFADGTPDGKEMCRDEDGNLIRVYLPWHYTRVARELAIFDQERDCREATAEEKEQAKWRLVHGKVCSPPPREHAAWQDFESGEYDFGSFQERLDDWRTRDNLKGGAADLVRWSYRIGEMYSDSYEHTNMLDAGADIYEVTMNLIRDFDASYLPVYFRRGNREFSPNAVAFHTADRYFERLRSYHWGIAGEIAYYGSDWSFYTDIDDMEGPSGNAYPEIFNTLARVVLMPQPGTYVDDETGIFDATSTPNSSASFTITVGDGRFVEHDYDSSPSGGGSWDYMSWVKRAGFSAEKARAFLALCDGRAALSSISRDNALDGRDNALNFRTAYPEAFDRLIGGMLAEDWATIGMSVSRDVEAGEVTTPKLLDLIDEPNRKKGDKVVFPNLGHEQQLWSALFATYYARESTDMTLANKMRIWVEGIDGNIANEGLPDLGDQLRFYNPQTGLTYIARRYGTESMDGRKIEKGIGSRMLQRANELVTASFEVVREGGEPVLDEFGMPVLITNEEGMAIPLTSFDSRINELTRYVGLLDSMRQISSVFGAGPL